MGEEYYERLGVPSDASMAEIASAYRERLKETHPDVNDASDAGERTKRLIEAKEVLTDETERARYDRMGHARYVRVEQGTAPDSGDRDGDGSGEARRATDERTASRDSTESSSDSTDTTGADTTAAAGGPRGRRTGTDGETSTRGGRTTRGANYRGTRSGRVDWGTHTARQGRGRHTDGIDWEEWAETDWDAVADAVWEDVTSERSDSSSQGSTGGGAETEKTRRGDSASGGRNTSSGWSDTAPSGPNGTSETGRDAAASATTDVGADSPGGGAAAAGSSSGPAGSGPTAGSGEPTAGNRDWTVGWYSEGDPSGTTRDAYSFGGSEFDGNSWNSWSPGSNSGSRYGRNSFPPHRIFSPLQTVVMFCLCFVTYPLLITGSVFPFFSLPVRLLLAVFLVFVVAMLIVLSQLGIVVFGGWSLLFPVMFLNFGVPVLAVPSLVTMGAVVISLGLAGVSRLLIRPPVV
jgi:curved DNA-binding protein CbpA